MAFIREPEERIFDSSMNDAWKQFEEAVAALLQALDPSAKVSHDQQIADLDTGLPRQRDVWVETSFGGHFAIEILVSCKRKKSKISQQDMDAFIGELRSSGAHKGVLYSYSGFTKPALSKAEKLGISCCILHKNSPPQLPEVLAFTAYHFLEQPQLVIDPAPAPPGHTWSHILELPALHDDGQRPAIEALAALFHADDESMRTRLSELPPPQRIVEVGVAIEGLPVRLVLQTHWVAHRAKMESWLVDGSYSLTDRDFKGSLSTPSVDMWSSNPGPGWEPIDADHFDGAKNVTAFVRMIGDIAAGLRAWATNNNQKIYRSTEEPPL